MGGIPSSPSGLSFTGKVWFLGMVGVGSGVSCSRDEGSTVCQTKSPSPTLRSHPLALGSADNRHPSGQYTAVAGAGAPHIQGPSAGFGALASDPRPTSLFLGDCVTLIFSPSGHGGVYSTD